jgi:glyoxylase I family protein
VALGGETLPLPDSRLPTAMISPHTPLHVALNVSDLAQAEAFYGGVLGLPTADRPLSFPGQWYQIGEFQIHLIVADKPYPRPPQSEKWGRHPHLALAVKDVDATATALERAGYPVQRSASGRAALFTQDPDGNVIELTDIGDTPGPAKND